MPRNPSNLSQPLVMGTLDQDDVPTQDIVPAAFSATRAKRLQPEDTRDPRALETMRNQDVIVHANGVEYRGLLQGADEGELYLRTDLRYISIPLERVIKVELATAKQEPLQAHVVEPGFYAPSKEDPED